MKNARVMTVTALTMTVGLALTGCSGQGGGDEELGPLDVYLEQSIWGAFDDGDDWVKTEVKRQNDVEKAVAECMTEQGFEYVPYEYSEEDFGVGSDDGDDGADEEWDPVEDAKKTGYGISFMYDDSEEDLDVEEDTWVDPNGDYLESLSESDMMAYQEALSGPMPADDADEEEWTNWEPSGCQGEAQEAVGGMDDGSEVYEDPEFTDLMTAIDNRYEEVESAPELVEVQREWASCMDDRGFGGYTNSTEPMEELNAEYAELMGWEDESGGEIIELDPEVEQAFQKKEIETAVADYECQDQAGVDDAWTAADLKSQEKFVEAHRDQLDALVAKYGSKS